MSRVRARKLSRFKKQLHGCVGADCSYVFGPENKEVHCPECGVARYSLDGKPKEVSHSLFRSPIYIFTFTIIDNFLSLCLCLSLSLSLSLNVQVCWYFPLTQQLKALLEVGNYRGLLMYEREHRRSRRDDAFMCDLYDSPRWQTLAGPLCNDARNRSLARIVLHMCVDGVEAFSHGRLPSGSTVKPLQYFVGNLAP